MNYDLRVQKILEAMQRDGADALLVTRGTDIRYVSGFSGEAGVAVIILSSSKNYLITDGRFTSQAKQETKGFEIVLRKTGQGLYEAAAELLDEMGTKRACLDTTQISHADYLELESHCHAAVENSKPYIADVRMVKDADELVVIRKACDITEQSFLALLNQVRPGQSEKEIRNILENEFRSRGSLDVAFETIVASGPVNGANPHASLTDRRIQQGDMITIDFGCKYEAYCSDITRTFALGRPSEEMMKIYNTVKAAKEAAESLLREGVSAREVHLAAETIINGAGYPLLHGPGHGFGLDIHENPFLSSRSKYWMEQNVVHTLEPGIYVPGVCGVRIEDDYLITQEGAECLTPNITRDLIIL